MEFVESSFFSMSNLTTTDKRALQLYDRFKPADSVSQTISTVGKALCNLVIDKIGRDRFSNYEQCSNYICNLCDFNSDRFYNLVSRRDCTIKLVEHELDIIEYVLRNNKLEDWIEYYFSSSEPSSKTVEDVILDIIEFGVYTNICGVRKSFYEISEFIRSLNLGYVFCKDESSYLSNSSELFTLKLVPTIGTVLRSSLTNNEYTFKDNSSFLVQVYKDSVKIKFVDTLENQEYTFSDLKVFDCRNLSKIYLIANGEEDE